MSILLTDDEVAAIGQELSAANNVSDLDFARAIQLALIEKLRKEPYLWYAPRTGDTTKNEQMGEVGWPACGFDTIKLYRLPTPQELEKE